MIFGKIAKWFVIVKIKYDLQREYKRELFYEQHFRGHDPV